jgi:hypothetical protein
MAASLNQSDSAYTNFNDGVVGAMNSAMVTQGQIVRNFGMQPPAYWLESQMSTPGPMTGGAPILNANQFSQGVMW